MPGFGQRRRRRGLRLQQIGEQLFIQLFGPVAAEDDVTDVGRRLMTVVEETEAKVDLRLHRPLKDELAIELKLHNVVVERQRDLVPLTRMERQLLRPAAALGLVEGV